MTNAGVWCRRVFGTDKVGYRQMLQAGREYPDRVWAVEGCNGIGKHIAHRLGNEWGDGARRLVEAVSWNGETVAANAAHLARLQGRELPGALS